MLFNYYGSNHDPSFKQLTTFSDYACYILCLIFDFVKQNSLKLLCPIVVFFLFSFLLLFHKFYQQTNNYCQRAATTATTTDGNSGQILTWIAKHFSKILAWNTLENVAQHNTTEIKPMLQHLLYMTTHIQCGMSRVMVHHAIIITIFMTVLTVLQEKKLLPACLLACQLHNQGSCKQFHSKVALQNFC